MMVIEGALRRERTFVAAALIIVVALAWSYLWQGAGMGMTALDMTALSLFPHLQADVMGDMDAAWTVVVAMWWVMMIAMMTPSAAPLVLLYGLVLRRHAAEDRSVCLSSLLLLSGYLTVWLMFAIVAAVLQKALLTAGLISAMMLWSHSAVLSASLLAAAGLYQFSTLKRVCLTQCADPVRFLTTHWRSGRLGSFMLGIRHGAYCVGCCWMLMALLFVGGVMNLIWIAMLTAVVLAEKLLPVRDQIGKFSGGVLMVWAIATLLV